MDDLETQLHRYADQVEAAIGEVTLPSVGARRSAEAPTSSRRSPLLLAAAAVVLVLIGAAALVLRADDSSSPAATEPEDTVAPDPSPTDEADADQSGADVIVVIPDAVGLEVDAARQLLLDADLAFDVVFETRDDTVANRVFAQDPPGGQRVEPGTVIALRVSSGALETVPNVTGLPADEAVDILERLGYEITVLATAEANGSGLVLGQFPGPGRR